MESGLKMVFSPNKADQPCQFNPGKDTDAVDSHIPWGGRTARHKGLMPFVQAGEAHAEQPGGKHQPPAPQTVYIQGEGYGDGKQEVFRHMSSLRT